MARPPNYDFERRERQKAKDAKRAEKAQAKRNAKDGEAGADPGAAQAQHVVGEVDAAIARDKLQNE